MVLHICCDYLCHSRPTTPLIRMEQLSDEVVKWFSNHMFQPDLSETNPAFHLSHIWHWSTKTLTLLDAAIAVSATFVSEIYCCSGLTGMHARVNLYTWLYISLQYLKIGKKCFWTSNKHGQKTAIPIGPIGVLNCDMTTCTSSDCWDQSRDIIDYWDSICVRKRKVKNAIEHAINITRKTAILIGLIGVLNCEMTTFISSDRLVQSHDISFHPFWLGGYNSVPTTQNHIKETLRGLYSTSICSVPSL